MLGTAVPETTVDKHRQPLRAENKIRLAKERLVAPPAGDPVRPEDRNHPQLRGLVPFPTNVRHHLRTLRLGENVRHLEI